MSANDQESRVPLKLLIDDKKNQVIAVESNRDFVDILFSFLTFPIGTIIRLTSSQPVSKILRLLTCSFISKSPLAEVFLNKKANIVDNNIIPETRISPLFADEFQYSGNSWKINLKLILSKSRNKILYAEANDSFVNFLFSFLTFPIGSVIHVLNGISGLGCIDNLYKSVTDLESEWFPYFQYRLLNPGVAPRHKCQNQLLPISVGLDDHRLLDPRCTSGGTSDFGRLTLSPSLFIVSDDLVVRPMCSTSSFGLLKELNVPLCDIEEQVIFIDKAEARLLLQAAFIGSSSALTLALRSFLNIPKQEKD